MFVVALVLSMSILGGIGYYSSIGVEIDPDSHNDDVVAAADNLDAVEFGEGRSDSILEGPLAAITPAVGIFQGFTTVVTNTSGLLQLLFGLPAIVADTIETFFRIAMLVTLVYLIRSGGSV